MASQLVWKVYNGRELVATTRFAEDAAAIVGITPDGVVKVDGRVVWREGHNGNASDSYDAAAAVMMEQRRRHFAERYAARLRRQLPGVFTLEGTS